MCWGCSEALDKSAGVIECVLKSMNEPPLLTSTEYRTKLLLRGFLILQFLIVVFLYACLSVFLHIPAYHSYSLDLQLCNDFNHH